MKLLEILDAVPFPIGYRIAFITNFMREPLLRQIERDFGLIRPELTVLMCVSLRQDVIARDICEVTEQPSNTVSRAVASLDNKKLLLRSRDRTDTRRQVLNITDAGQRVHDEILKRFAAVEEKMLADFDPSEKETLHTLLDRIARAVDDWRLRSQ